MLSATFLFAFMLAPGFSQPLTPVPPDQIIVVGRLSDLQIKLSPGVAEATARLTVSRVVKGSLSPGAGVAIEWEFRCTPQLTMDMVTKSAPLFGLLQMQRIGDGRYQPQAVDLRSPDRLGGVVLQLPEGPASSEFAYAPDAPLDLRLASEFASALSLILQKSGEPATSTGGRRDPNGEWAFSLSGEPARFSHITMRLLSLDTLQTAPLYRQLLRSPSPNLRSIGIAALLKTADEEAFQVLEREAPQLAGTLAAYQFSAGLRTLDIRKAPKLAAPVGRLALQETEIPNFEFPAISLLGRAPTAEALPYLAAFLESPYNATRAYTVVSLCNFARSYSGTPQSPSRLWKPEMQEYCPSTFPLRRPADEPHYTTFWRGWYASEGAAFRREFQLPEPRIPARFRDAAIVDAPEPEVSMEARFNAWIRTLLTTEQRRLTNPTPDQPAQMFAGRLTAEEESLVMGTVHRLESEFNRMKQELMGPGQASRTMPPKVAIDQAETARRELLHNGLEELKRGLTPRGWQVVEQSLLGMAISIHSPGALGPWD